MIDTVGLESPAISEAVALAAEQSCHRRSSVEIATGQVAWDFVSGSLGGSWDHSVSIKVKRERYDGRLMMNVPCEPFLFIEASIHKAIMGHNLFGGPIEPVPACRWFVAEVARRLGVDLPDGLDWIVTRIDYAEVFDLQTEAACQEYMRGLRLAAYPRRRVNAYDDDTLMIPGSTTSFKVYRKFPEFLAHDSKRLRPILSESLYISLRDSATGRLRVESGIKSRKLNKDFGGKPKVSQLTLDYLSDVYDTDSKRVFRDAESGHDLVRKHRDVRCRLDAVYSPELSRLLFGVWSQLAMMGEKEYRRSVPSATFYRQRKQLTEAGCSWIGTNVRVSAAASLVPAGFSPVRSDSRRLSDESQEVIDALAPYRTPVSKM